LTTQDLNYSLVSPPFEVLASIALSPEFYDIHEPDFNNYHLMRSYQNPFRSVSKTSYETPRFIVKGEVERIAYEPISEIKKYVTNYALWGLIGLALTDESFGTMGAYVQYRFQVLDNSNMVIDSFLVTGAASGDPQKISRKELIGDANCFAAVDFSTQLFQRLRARFGIDIQSQSIKYYPLKVKAERWLYFIKVESKVYK
jgi:hypothetical protein